MANYQECRLYAGSALGEICEPDNPKRAIWYAAGCNFWTDDCSKLNRTGPGIPCCPECGCVGMIATAEAWEIGISKFEREGHPRYIEFCAVQKEKCDRGKKWMDLYRAFVQQTG